MNKPHTTSRPGKGQTGGRKSDSGSRPKEKSASPAGAGRAGTGGASPPAPPSGGAPGSGPENWDASLSDTVVLNGKCARNAAERHHVLDHAVSNVWAVEDLGEIRRVESQGRCMWVMWRRSSAPPA